LPCVLRGAIPGGFYLLEVRLESADSPKSSSHQPANCSAPCARPASILTASTSRRCCLSLCSHSLTSCSSRCGGWSDPDAPLAVVGGGGSTYGAPVGIAVVPGGTLRWGSSSSFVADSDRPIERVGAGQGRACSCSPSSRRGGVRPLERPAGGSVHGGYTEGPQRTSPMGGHRRA
jgi:hypothetical protein